MKKFLLLTLTFGLFTYAFSQQYDWTNISINIPYQADLTDVYFYSDTKGWITSAFADTTIFKTNDGGQTFEIQKVPLGENIWTVHMLDSLNGYCGGGGGWIYKTTDGGESWNILSSMGSVTDISFPPGTTQVNPAGYGCGDNGRVWEITSTLTNLHCPSNTDFSGISAPTMNNVWVCGGNRIYYYDGTDFTSQGGPTGTYNDIHFINNFEGWVVGNLGVIGKTSNGGMEWITLVNPDSQNRSLYSVFFLDANNGWAAGVNGIILRTTNGGTNWSIEASGLTTEGLAGIHFTSPTNGYAAGNNKTLLKYSEVSGIDDNFKLVAFEVHPNPFKDKLKIKCTDFKTENGIVEILSLDGKLLIRKEVAKGNANREIDMNNLVTGMYLCKISIGNRSSAKKIIKE